MPYIVTTRGMQNQTNPTVRAIAEIATPTTAWATRGHDTRRWAFYSLGASMGPIDTGKVHGPWMPYRSGIVTAAEEAVWTAHCGDVDQARALHETGDVYFLRAIALTAEWEAPLS